MGPIYSDGDDDMMYIGSADAGDDNDSDDNEKTACISQPLIA
jgi:hypothetical protein